MTQDAASTTPVYLKGLGPSRTHEQDGRRAVDQPAPMIATVDPVSVGNSNPLMSMVQSTQNGSGHDMAVGLDCARDRRILAKGKVSSRLVVIVVVRAQKGPKMPLAKDDNVVKAISLSA